MSKAQRRRPAVLGIVGLASFGLLVGQGARAEDGPVAPRPPAASAHESVVFDVRVVRVDPADPTVVEAPPPWQPGGAAAATTTLPWADLLAGLKARGRTTILLDQRVTATDGTPTEFKQERRRAAQTLRHRNAMNDAKTEVWETTFAESGASGELVVGPDGLRYRVDVRWDERAAMDEVASAESASWRGSHAPFPTGETLVLSHRQQHLSGEGVLRALELYVLVTASRVAARR